MGNEFRRVLLGGHEVDIREAKLPWKIHSAKCIRYAKRTVNRRERREGAIDVDTILAELSDDVKEAGTDRWGGANLTSCGGPCCGRRPVGEFLGKPLTRAED